MPEQNASLPASGRPKGRPVGNGAAELTERIVEVASRRFVTGGYETTSMEAIASETGISKRTLYARFPSKPVLLQAVADYLFSETRSEFTRYRDRPEPAEAVLREMAHHMHGRVLMPFSIDVYRLFVSQSQRLRDEAGVALGGDRYLRSLVAALSMQFRRGLESGEIRGEWPADLLAEQFLEAICAADLRRLVFAHELPDDEDGRRHRVDQRFDLFFAGLRPSAAQAIGAGAASPDARASRSDDAEAPPERDRKPQPRCMSENRMSC